MVDESLGDVPPGCGWTTDQQVDKQKKHDGCGRKERKREKERGGEGEGGEKEKWEVGHVNVVMRYNNKMYCLPNVMAA